MNYPEIIHHGGVSSITGSCHQLLADEYSSVLIDCGLRLDGEAEGDDSESLTDFSLKSIKALILTHVHVDHVGRIPDLLAAGYIGPIICSEPSAQMLPITLEDVCKHQFGHDTKRIERCLAQVKAQTIGVPFDAWYSLVDTPLLVVRIQLRRAGHILGSAYVECDIQYPTQQREKRIVFSGDLGSSHNPLLRKPESPTRADVLVLESTYGDRIHENRESRQARLEQVIDRALADHGTILIPAFSIGRTQELLFEIEDILRRKALVEDHNSELASDAASGLPINWPQLPIVLDSPLASRFTAVYQQFADYWNSEAQERLSQGRRPLGFGQLITVDSHDKHLQVVNYLSSTGRPAIVIAGSGMCSGGRIVNYLKAMLGDPRHNVVFVGYQAKDTPGAAIQKYGPVGGYVELDKDRFEIKAGITTVGGYSAHADQQELLGFVTGMAAWPAEIRLVHGERRAKDVLATLLKRKYSLENKSLKLDIPKR
ncbi:MBL fold metallo-hydrolase RNA specificity domain-containing protein [Pseudomonas viridiflava]|uniref:MBL fold metallo-hydrolase RNA specificity domain-containing protein n=1 Tax=Pseudomonas viridiflava TaxID=33069 RepID=UPI000F05189C|nr:MBL fold metallo-hydrolase [Pseudomonas viridiflava]